VTVTPGDGGAGVASRTCMLEEALSASQ